MREVKKKITNKKENTKEKDSNSTLDRYLSKLSIESKNLNIQMIHLSTFHKRLKNYIHVVFVKVQSN